MNRTPFKPKGYEPRQDKVYAVHTPRARAVAVYDGTARMTVCLPQPKENAIQHEGYMSLVRLMPCEHCRRAGPSQFCHSDEGKGLNIKTDCRKGWPGCADGPGRTGCHTFIGSTGTFTRDQRRYIEAAHSARVRARVIAAGQWPHDLPLWPADEAVESST